ncbi:hypothetical protein EYF80_018388 [Liparis tanakae]|uniref:Uncharacterized protein n=1 Tax=Liparis tanakae TaxID=230148 RepID=A0A4Z2I013_9TELE|nr:hypothetical protein EYF80_018388 [Liparis tanakae]
MSKDVMNLSVDGARRPSAKQCAPMADSIRGDSLQWMAAMSSPQEQGNVQRIGIISSRQRLCFRQTSHTPCNYLHPTHAHTQTSIQFNRMTPKTESRHGGVESE